MPENPLCAQYTPWMDHGVNINECLEIFKGKCGESLAVYYQQDCPWGGYPCAVDDGEGRWKAPDPTPEQKLAQNCLQQDREVEKG